MLFKTKTGLGLELLDLTPLEINVVVVIDKHGWGLRWSCWDVEMMLLRLLIIVTKDDDIWRWWWIFLDDAIVEIFFQFFLFFFIFFSFSVFLYFWFFSLFFFSLIGFILWFFVIFSLYLKIKSKNKKEKDNDGDVFYYWALKPNLRHDGRYIKILGWRFGDLEIKFEIWEWN